MCVCSLVGHSLKGVIVCMFVHVIAFFRFFLVKVRLYFHMKYQVTINYVVLYVVKQ